MFDIFRIIEIVLANLITLIVAYIIYKLETRDNILFSIYNPLYAVLYELSELINDTVEGYKSLYAFNMRYSELVRWLDEILINRGGLIKIFEDDKELGKKIMELASCIYHLYVLTQEVHAEISEDSSVVLEKDVKKLNELLNVIRDTLQSRLEMHH